MSRYQPYARPLCSVAVGYFGLWSTWRVVRALKMTRDTTGAGAGRTAFVQYWACAVAPQTARSEGGGNDERVHEGKVEAV